MMLFRAIVLGVQTARTRWLLSAASITTVAFVLVLAAVPWLVLTNLQTLASRWAEHAPVAALLQDSLTANEQNAALDALRAVEGVASAALLLPEQNLERLRSGGAEAQALAASIDASVLPTVVELTPLKTHHALAQLETLAKAAGSIPGVVEVDFGQQEFGDLQAMAAKLRTLGRYVAAFVLLLALVIVANTVRLTVYARQDEIAIQHLVGATGFYVRAPFVAEGVGWGLLGGGLACLLVRMALPWLASLPVPIAALPRGFEIVCLAGGAGLGLIASLVAMVRLPGDDRL